MTKLVCGIGINDGKYPAYIVGKVLKEYDLWQKLLKRAYSPKYQEKFPTYVGCSASDNFKSYSYFYEWCQNQIGFGQSSFQLDKDLLIKGNKIYSEETCLFLPSQLNSLLISSKAARGDLPIGVHRDKGRFRALCHSDALHRHVGYFNTPELAFQAYKQAKEAFIKRQAEKWKNFIDPRAYEALMCYEVLITD